MNDNDQKFLTLLGNLAAIKIVDFFISNSPCNYNKSQVVSELRISRNTAFRAWDMLESFGILKTVSSDKRTRFYILNKENKITRLLIKIHAEVMAD